MVDALVNEKLLVIGYYLARCADLEGEIDVNPPKALEVGSWAEAYDLFYPSLADDRTYAQFALHLNSLRDSFDKILENSIFGNRIDSHDALLNIHWIWKDRSDDDLTQHVLAWNRVAISSRKTRTIDKSTTLISISSKARALLRKTITSDPRWPQYKAANGKFISGYSKEDYVAACAALDIDIITIIKDTGDEPTAFTKNMSVSVDPDFNKVAGKFAPISKIMDDPNQTDWEIPIGLAEQVTDAGPLIDKDWAVALGNQTNIENVPVIIHEDPPIIFLDLSDQLVKGTIELAQKRGFVTYEELNKILPFEEITGDRIEQIFTMLNEIGISIFDYENSIDGLFFKLINNIKDQILEMNNEGARLFGISHYSEAKYCAEIGNKLYSFHQKLLDMKLEWDQIAEEKNMKRNISY